MYPRLQLGWLQLAAVPRGAPLISIRIISMRWWPGQVGQRAHYRWQQNRPPRQCLHMSGVSTFRSWWVIHSTFIETIFLRSRYVEELRRVSWDYNSDLISLNVEGERKSVLVLGLQWNTNRSPGFAPRTRFDISRNCTIHLMPMNYLKSCGLTKLTLFGTNAGTVCPSSIKTTIFSSSYPYTSNREVSTVSEYMKND